MNGRLFVMGMCACILLAAGDAMAASGTLTGSGANAHDTETTENDAVATLRSALQEYLLPHGTAAVPSAERRSWETVSKRLIRHLHESRAACREDSRRSNRDTRMSVLLRCMRADLLQQSVLLRAQERLLRSIPLPSSGQDMVLKPLEEAAEAMESIVIGIDSRVFSNEAALTEAKSNLWEHYLHPYRLSLLRLHVLRQHVWMAAAAQLESMNEESASCLLSAQATLRKAMEMTDYGETEILLAKAESENAHCRELLKKAAAADAASATGATLEEGTK